MTDLFRDLAAAGDPRALTIGPWIRRAVTVVLASVVVLALLDVFGQRPSASVAATPRAVLRLTAPEAVRGGLFFESRVEIRAVDAIDHPRLVLDPGWLEGMTVNTIEPSPVGEGSHDGRLTLTLGHIPRGSSHLLFMQFQVDPTNIGRRAQTVELYDGGRKLATVHRTITVFP
jgi:hypothetical protein